MNNLLVFYYVGAMIAVLLTVWLFIRDRVLIKTAELNRRHMIFILLINATLSWFSVLQALNISRIKRFIFVQSEDDKNKQKEKRLSAYQRIAQLLNLIMGEKK